MAGLDGGMGGNEAGPEPVDEVAAELPVLQPEPVDPSTVPLPEALEQEPTEPSDPGETHTNSEDELPPPDEAPPVDEPEEPVEPGLEAPEQEPIEPSDPGETHTNSENEVPPPDEAPPLDEPEEPAEPGPEAPEQEPIEPSHPGETHTNSEDELPPPDEAPPVDEPKEPAEPGPDRAEPRAEPNDLDDQAPPLDEPEEDQESVSTRTERQIKGDEFEKKTTDEMLQIPGMKLIYGGEKSHGFDPCFYHPDVGIIVTDAKDFGSEEKPGYVNEVSAFKPEHIAPNMTKMLTDIDANETIPQETKDEVWQAFHDNRGKFLVVGSDTTRMSENKQAEWGQFTKISDLQSTLDSLRKK